MKMQGRTTEYPTSPSLGRASLQKIILHIGMSKAGSSAIQQALIENREVLAQVGIGLPGASRMKTVHINLKQELRQGQPLGKLTEIVHEASHYHTAVLSWEGFWLMNAAQIEYVKAVLSAYDTSVMLYLRRPVDYLRSSYRQGIKQKGRTRTCEIYLNVVRMEDRMNYPLLLKRWARFFPTRVRAYEAVRGSIEEDFMRAIGVPLEDVDVGRHIVNQTPSDGALKLMVLANRCLPARISKQVRQAIRRSGRRFDFMPPIDDGLLRQYGEEVVRTWDLDVMRKYMSEADLALLVANEEDNELA